MHFETYRYFVMRNVTCSWHSNEKKMPVYFFLKFDNAQNISLLKFQFELNFFIKLLFIVESHRRHVMRGKNLRGKVLENIKWKLNNGSSVVSMHFFVKSSCPIIKLFRCKVLQNNHFYETNKQTLCIHISFLNVTKFWILQFIGHLRSYYGWTTKDPTKMPCFLLIRILWTMYLTSFHIQFSCFFCVHWYGQKGNANNAFITSIHTYLNLSTHTSYVCVCEYHGGLFEEINFYICIQWK